MAPTRRQDVKPVLLTAGLVTAGGSFSDPGAGRQTCQHIVSEEFTRWLPPTIEASMGSCDMTHVRVPHIFCHTQIYTYHMGLAKAVRIFYLPNLNNVRCSEA